MERLKTAAPRTMDHAVEMADGSWKRKRPKLQLGTRRVIDESPELPTSLLLLMTHRETRSRQA